MVESVQRRGFKPDLSKGEGSEGVVLGRVSVGDVRKGDEVVIRGVVLDQFKGCPRETGYFEGRVVELGNESLSVHVDGNFVKRFGEEEEELLDEEGILTLEKTQINEIFVKTLPPAVLKSNIVFTPAKAKTEAPVTPASKPEVVPVEKPKQTKEEKQKIISSFLQTQRKNLLKRIKRQMEYYFSDKNFPKDDFLQKEVASNGCVSFDVLLTFNKLKDMGATKDLIIESIADSEVCTLNSDKTGVLKSSK